jgi:hypothetical protein
VQAVVAMQRRFPTALQDAGKLIDYFLLEACQIAETLLISCISATILKSGLQQGYPWIKQ